MSVNNFKDFPLMSKCGKLQANMLELSNNTAIVYIYKAQDDGNMRNLMCKKFDNVAEAAQWAHEKVENVVWTLLQA